MLVEQFKQLFEDVRMPKHLTEEGDSCCIWEWVHHAKSNKILDRTPVLNLELKLLIAQVEELLKYQHLEKDQWINPLSTGIALTFLAIATIKKRQKAIRY